MFIKPFKTKSNVQLKSSDRKKLQAKVQQQFKLSETDLSQLFTTKSTICQIKVITHSDQIVTVYSCDKRPMFFETSDSTLIPTVYSLWLVPEILPNFTTHPAVLPRLANGADLMLPGVIKQGQGLRSYGYHKKDELIAVNLTSNRAAVGIGMLARSSEDLYMSGGVGIAVKMLHVFGDKLWSIDSAACLQMPSLGAGFEMPKDDDFPALGADKPKKSNEKIISEAPKEQSQLMIDEFPALGISNKKNSTEVSEVKTEEIDVDTNSDNQPLQNDDGEVNDSLDTETIVEEPLSEDDVLKTAFLTCLKRDGKSLNLPLLTSNFYRCHVIPAAERPIELRKTSYKKLSKFLDEMQSNRFITVKEENKGIEKIVAVNLQHPDLIEFIPKIFNKSDADDKSTPGNSLFVSEMTELYLVTEETAQLFAHFNMGIGEGIESGQVKKYLKEYVCNNKLQNIQNTKEIRPNELLSKLCTECEYIMFDELLSIVLGKMTHSFEMRSKNEIKGSKRPIIQMTLATRSGNKKVTLVSNLESYGIRLTEFEKACRLGVAASTSVVKVPHQKCEQLLVQGNQIRFIHKLLTETYKIPSKYIGGMELAKKEKKHKK